MGVGGWGRGRDGVGVRVRAQVWACRGRVRMGGEAGRWGGGAAGSGEVWGGLPTSGPAVRRGAEGVQRVCKGRAEGGQRGG